MCQVDNYSILDRTEANLILVKQVLDIAMLSITYTANMGVEYLEARQKYKILPSFPPPFLSPSPFFPFLLNSVFAFLKKLLYTVGHGSMHL